MSKRIYLSPPHLSGEELMYVKEAFDTNWIAPTGPAVTAFEKELCDYNSVGHCLAVSSGTAAIHLALIVLGVEAGDEVICSTFTFSGSCNPIVYQNATPVFIDSEPDSWNMDAELMKEAIEDRIRKGKKPKAIIVVHLFGMPANMREIMKVARHYDIPVIEDAAEALGSLYEGKKAGSIGDIGIYSFNGNKIITTSGGGAVVSNRGDWIERARYLSSQSRSPAPYYQHEAIGYNYQLSNICAAIGVAQMLVLEQRISQRRNIYHFYRKVLDEYRFAFQPEARGSFSNRWLSTVLVEHESITNEEIRKALEVDNIETRLLWKPMHRQPVFAASPAYLNGVSDMLFKKGLCLPSGSALELSELEFICEKINRILK